jgi:microcystin degradation protein MlrC
MLNLVQHNEQPPPVILKQPVVILNLFQDNEKPSPVILKQVQDDEGGGGRGGG